MIEAGIRTPLGFDGLGITHDMAGGEGFPIHHRHHGMDTGSGSDGGPAESGDKGFRQGQAAGFHHDAVEVVGPLQQLKHGGQKLILHRAAEAAVRQFHQPALKVVAFAEAAGGQEIAINADLAEFIHHHSEPQAALQEQVSQQGGLAGAEKTGHHRHRQASGRGGRHGQPTRADQVQAAPRPSSTEARVRRVVVEQAAALWRRATRARRSRAPWLINRPSR